ncbi:MAG: carboxypeptidase-like regulatory domain-containing protein [Bacteroidia bacterium]
MNTLLKYSFFVCLLLGSLNGLAQDVFRVSGTIVDDKTKQPVVNATVRVQNSGLATASDEKGNFSLHIPFAARVSLLISHVAYTKKTRELYLQQIGENRTIIISLSPKSNLLDTISIKANYAPDTLVRSGKFSIYDFDFYEDKFILLTAEKGMDKAELKLATEEGAIQYTIKIPSEAGKAKELHHDYMGYTNLICEQAVYRIIVYNTTLLIFSLDPEDYNAFIKPVADSLRGKLFFSDYWKEYPAFNYYAYEVRDSVKKKLITVSNDELLKLYNLEYYYMNNRQRLEARTLAGELKVDEHIIAALMTGFSKSMYYEPLYAPLFILKDTICVFDHYKDLLFHFDRQGEKIDSVRIRYNHPKNWREWKRLMIKDETENEVYAVFSRDGHKYLKLISHRDGEDKGRYTLQFHSADKIKIKNGYAYYVYRPFESTQEKFLYRELITLSKSK